MRAAIRTVWTEPPERFDEDIRLQDHRRLVYHFWQMAATLARRNVIDKQVLFDLYGDAINVWDKLRPIEVRKMYGALRERYPEKSDAELAVMAEEMVTTS